MINAPILNMRKVFILSVQLPQAFKTSNFTDENSKVVCLLSASAILLCCPDLYFTIKVNFYA